MNCLQVVTAEALMLKNLGRILQHFDWCLVMLMVTRRFHHWMIYVSEAVSQFPVCFGLCCVDFLELVVSFWSLRLLFLLFAVSTNLLTGWRGDLRLYKTAYPSLDCVVLTKHILLNSCLLILRFLLSRLWLEHWMTRFLHRCCSFLPRPRYAIPCGSTFYFGVCRIAQKLIFRIFGAVFYRPCDVCVTEPTTE